MVPERFSGVPKWRQGGRSTPRGWRTLSPSPEIETELSWRKEGNMLLK